MARGKQIFMQSLLNQGVRYIFGNPGTTETTLIDALADKNKLVRRKAAEALGLIGDKQAIEALAKTQLADESPDVRTVAAAALKSIRSKAAREDRANASNGKQITPIIEKLIELKIYIGAGTGVFLLLVGLIIARIRRRKSFSVRPANIH